MRRKIRWTSIKVDLAREGVAQCQLLCAGHSGSEGNERCSDFRMLRAYLFTY